MFRRSDSCPGSPGRWVSSSLQSQAAWPHAAVLTSTPGCPGTEADPGMWTTSTSPTPKHQSQARASAPAWFSSLPFPSGLWDAPPQEARKNMSTLSQKSSWTKVSDCEKSPRSSRQPLDRNKLAISQRWSCHDVSLGIPGWKSDSREEAQEDVLPSCAWEPALASGSPGTLGGLLLPFRRRCWQPSLVLQQLGFWERLLGCESSSLTAHSEFWWCSVQPT